MNDVAQTTKDVARLTPERARQVIKAQSFFPYWGNYEKFLNPEELAEVRELFQRSENGNITLAGIVQRRARSDCYELPPGFDEQDAAIARDKLALWNERRGPRVGDFVKLRDGTVRRFTHDWGDSLQTTMAGSDGSFYFSQGCMSYSGGLDPAIPKSELIETENTQNGSAWFFHHNHSGAHRGVYFTVPCRVYRQE